MPNNEASYDAMMRELEAEFADLGEWLSEETDEVDEQEAVTNVIELLEQAHKIVNQVRSSTANSGGDETASQAIELRLAAVENSLAGVDAQLAALHAELAALRQLLSRA